MIRRAVSRQPRTLADWLAALERAGWDGKRVGREHVGPCPRCGGTDRFHVAEGSTVAVLAGCRHGCTFEDLAAHLFPSTARGTPRRRRFRRLARGSGGRRDDPGRTRPKTRPKAPDSLEAISGDSGGPGPRIPPKTDRSAENGPVGSPLTDERHSPKGRSTPENRPGVHGHAVPVNAARRLWRRSGPVPTDPAHPARRWAARRHLWRPGDPWPDAVRWIEGPGGGSLVAAFAPVAAWIEAHPPASPPGVQLVHVDADGRPRKDRGGLSKRSRGSMTGAVCVIGPLWRSGPLHVAEGIADALAVAAREDGAVIAAGGTATLARIAGAVAALSRLVTLWPDGDGPGRLAARRLALALRDRGAVVALAAVPDGEDPASMARPFTPGA